MTYFIVIFALLHWSGTEPTGFSRYAYRVEESEGLRGNGKYPAQVKGVQEIVSGLLSWQRYIVEEIRRIINARLLELQRAQLKL